MTARSTIKIGLNPPSIRWSDETPLDPPAFVRIGLATPWGKADSAEIIAEGIGRVGTPSHGGIKLDRKRNAAVPAYFRRKGGWYEEDCDAAIPALVFDAEFSAYIEGQEYFSKAEYASKAERHRAFTVQSLKNWHPHEYAKFTGEEVKLEESSTLRREHAANVNADKLVAGAAFGDWSKNVPFGQVGVIAVVGGRDRNGRARGESSCWLVPEAEYAKRSELPNGDFIVDPDRHEKVDGPFGA